MTPDPPAGSEAGSSSSSGGSSDVGALIFVSDASAEAERLISGLRTRGYQVVDVPLGLLVNRVSVQRPALILCDADAPGAVESVERIHRDVPGGHRVDVIFVRESTLSLPQEMLAALEREASGTFERPVDVAALTHKVEALIGPPTRPDPRPRVAAGGRAPILVAATRRPFRYDQKPSASLVPEPPSASTWVAPTAPPSSPTSSPSAVPEPALVPSSLRPNDAVPLSIAPTASQLPQARLSPELEMLLGRAEQRVAQGRGSVAPPSDRLSPEAELDAILPHDVLAALDEPLDLDDGDDSDVGPSTHGGDDKANTRTGGESTKAGNSKAPGAHTSSAAGPPSVAEPIEQARTEPPPKRETEPPRTPAAVAPRGAAITSGGWSEPIPSSEAEPRGTAAGVHSDLPPSAAEAGGAASRSTRPPRPAGPIGAGAPGSEPAPTQPPSALAAPMSAPSGVLELPRTLRSGEAIRCLAKAVRSRYTGAVAFEAPDGMRRIVFRDGDFVTAATSFDNESIVACLIERGSLPADASLKLGRKLPLFGRHAGAALIAHGYLQQDELWQVLRWHAEWLIGRIAKLERAETGVEPEIPLRLATEPAVFGGATGAEVLIELVRRVFPPETSLTLLGGAAVRLAPGPSHALLGECALGPEETELVRSLEGVTLGEAMARAKSPDFCSALLALVELGVLEAAEAGSKAPRPVAPTPGVREPDRLDDDALRSRIAARRALVDDGDYFALLGVSRSATGYDVRRAYAELREQLDPARILTPATVDLRDDVDAILAMIDEAFEILADDVRRERYRRALEAAPL